jgi:hypothetical protein
MADFIWEVRLDRRRRLGCSGKAGETMTRGFWHLMVFAAVFGTFVSIGTSSLQSGGQDATLAINVDDIGPKVTLVGRLGQPLGKMMKLRGSWKYPDGVMKDSALWFTVTAVNDRKLAKPVEFHIAQVSARTEDDKDAVPADEHEKDLDGVAWTLKAYETGRFSAVPDDGMAVQRPYWYRTFNSQVVGTVVP